jgi:hypothetical protein
MTHRIAGLLVALTIGIFLAPLTANAQSPTHMYRIGRLSVSSPPAGSNPFADAYTMSGRPLV